MNTTFTKLFVTVRCFGRRLRKQLTNAHTLRRLQNENRKLSAWCLTLDSHFLECKSTLEGQEERIDEVEEEVKMHREFGTRIDDVESSLCDKMDCDDLEKQIEESVDDAVNAAMDSMSICGENLSEYVGNLASRLDDLEKTVENNYEEYEQASEGLDTAANHAHEAHEAIHAMAKALVDIVGA